MAGSAPNPSAATAEGPGGPLAADFGSSFEGRLLFWIAVAFSAYQLATAAHILNLPSQVVRALHVGFLMLLGLPFVALLAGRPVKAASWVLGLVGFGVGVYQWVFYEDLLQRSGVPTQVDIVTGIAALAVLFVAAWRIMGPALPIISGLFLAYALWGEYLPAPLDHRPYDFTQIIDQMAYGTEG